MLPDHAAKLCQQDCENGHLQEDMCAAVVLLLVTKSDCKLIDAVLLVAAPPYWPVPCCKAAALS